MNKIRLFYQFDLTTESPLSIGASYSDLTDHDIIRYNDHLFDNNDFKNNNTPFIPSSSIAGSIFGKDEQFAKEMKIYKNINKNTNVENSPLFVTDGHFKTKLDVYKRDSNGLQKDEDNYKQTLKGAKFDSEIISKNESWSFIAVITIDSDKRNDIAKYDNYMISFANRINNGIYRIGFKQNRGFGRQKVNNLIKKMFTVNNFDEYLKFDFENYNLKGKQLAIGEIDNKEWITLEMPFKVVTPMCIKDYTVTGGPDYEQIKFIDKRDGNKTYAVIPATTINGVLQTSITEIAKELNIYDDISYVVYLDGDHEDNKNCIHFLNDDIKKYIVDEVYLNGEFLVQSRNAIDRFSNGTIDGALFTEKIFTPTNESKSTISLHFKKSYPLAYIALFYLALQNLGEGYASLGGNEAIGRGVIERTDEIKLTGEYIDENHEVKEITKKDLITKLKKFMNKEGY